MSVSINALEVIRRYVDERIICKCISECTSARCYVLTSHLDRSHGLHTVQTCLLRFQPLKERLSLLPKAPSWPTHALFTY